MMFSWLSEYVYGYSTLLNRELQEESSTEVALEVSKYEIVFTLDRGAKTCWNPFLILNRIVLNKNVKNWKVLKENIFIKNIKKDSINMKCIQYSNHLVTYKILEEHNSR